MMPSFTSKYLPSERVRGVFASLSLSQIKGFIALARRHLQTHAVLYLLIPLAWYLFSENYTIGFNQTPSLPQSVFIVHKNHPVVKGDYVAFRVPPGGTMSPKTIYTKIVVGVEGDTVTVRDRIVYVNGVSVGYAKTHSLKGAPLDHIEPTVVGRDQYYVMGLHRDSLDSRYTLIGLVSRAYLVGKATPVW